jgi:GntR family transcriptional regulator, vanillate catabolism transcriptional regulator
MSFLSERPDGITALSKLQALPMPRTSTPPLHAVETSAESAPGNESAQTRALLQLREMILSGELPAGSRIAELNLVDMLRVSRTPIRAALMRLEQEGLLQALPHGGFAVRTFSEREVQEAIELRGMIEGMAARLAAERGVAPVLLAEARQTLLEIDALLARPALSEEDFSSYVQSNQRFHQQLAQLCESSFVQRELERAASLPFASPSAFVVLQATSPKARDMLIVAQDQHWQALQAIEAREGARAEGVMREHSRLAQRNLTDAVRSATTRSLPGVQLIRRRS